jgi:hypothetical protein
MGGDSQGATQTASKEPWSAAIPWLTQNLNYGQNLQGYYQNNPFNALQQGAYANLLNGNDYINRMIPGLLTQMSQSGFDRSNPLAKPAPYRFAPMPTSTYQPVAGLLGTSLATAAKPPMPTPAPTPAPAMSTYATNFNDYPGG